MKLSIFAAMTSSSDKKKQNICIFGFQELNILINKDNFQSKGKFLSYFFIFEVILLF